MPWKTMDVHEQRVRFVVAASLATKPFRQLCEEFGVSRPTGYEWEARYRNDGLDGIAEPATDAGGVGQAGDRVAAALPPGAPRSPRCFCAANVGSHTSIPLSPVL